MEQRSDMVFNRVKDIIVDILAIEADKVVPDANFREDLGADSLDLVELIMAFEDEFGGRISDEDARELVTVQKAAEYVANRMQSGE
ncbi:MAG: acyl carrier protein [Anaerolineae bacterium]|nr:acyl carrier protein [Anaerolineae bacterium]